MHEVAVTNLISELRVGLSETGLCLRVDGARLPDLIRSGAASFAIVIGGAEVRVVPIDRPWIAVDAIVEIHVPFEQLGVASGDLQFAIQIRDAQTAVLEAVPQGRFWTIAIPESRRTAHDWQA